MKLRNYSPLKRIARKRWLGMKARCSMPSRTAYRDYGAKGIKVCERWQVFETFYADMGDPPAAEYSLDRYPDSTGNYEPGNVRWATPQEQSQNRQTTRWLTINSETLTAWDWALRIGVNYRTLLNRLDRGESPEVAITGPTGRYSRVAFLKTLTA